MITIRESERTLSRESESGRKLARQAEICSSYRIHFNFFKVALRFSGIACSQWCAWIVMLFFGCCGVGSFSQLKKQFVLAGLNSISHDQSECNKPCFDGPRDVCGREVERNGDT